MSDLKGNPETLNFIDNKEHVNIVFMGHVDAGKSTMCGQILLLTGQADERLVENYKRLAIENSRESWWIAYIMDTSDDERSKGKTVEVGTAEFETDKRRYSILDAPGHKNYVPAMISGAAQADIGILVVSARKGEYEAGFQKGGQTREHALLAKTLGISRIIIAVNKMDDPTVNWSKQRYDFIVTQTIVFLKQCGFREKDISSLPLSGLEGKGIINALPQKECSWAPSDYLFSLLDKQKVSRSKSSALRITVVSCYSDMGCIVVIGKIESGVLKQGQSVLLSPRNQKAFCETIMIGTDKVEAAKCGENVNVYLKGVSKGEIYVGDIVCGLDNMAPHSDFLQCQIYVYELLAHKPLITKGYSCMLHAHSITAQCEFSALAKLQNDKNEKPKKLNFAKANDSVLCKLKLANKIAIEKYSDFAQLGRFTLRDEGKTVAIGRVVKIL